jgi:hypothetical protein
MAIRHALFGETLHEDVRRFLDDPETALTIASDMDKSGVATLNATAALTTDIARLNERHDWPGLKAIGKITAIREINGQTTVATPLLSAQPSLHAETFQRHRP